MVNSGSKWLVITMANINHYEPMVGYEPLMVSIVPLTVSAAPQKAAATCWMWTSPSMAPQADPQRPPVVIKRLPGSGVVGPFSASWSQWFRILMRSVYQFKMVLQVAWSLCDVLIPACVGLLYLVRILSIWLPTAVFQPPMLQSRFLEFVINLIASYLIASIYLIAYRWYWWCFSTKFHSLSANVLKFPTNTSSVMVIGHD